MNFETLKRANELKEKIDSLTKRINHTENSIETFNEENPIEVQLRLVCERHRVEWGANISKELTIEIPVEFL